MLTHVAFKVRPINVRLPFSGDIFSCSSASTKETENCIQLGLSVGDENNMRKQK